MDPQASDRKLCVSLSSAPEVTARRHTDHATICRSVDCILFRIPKKTFAMFVLTAVGGQFLRREKQSVILRKRRLGRN